MNAPDTIYARSALLYEKREWSEVRYYDTDIAYIRADISYDLAKTVEAQKAEIGLLKAENDSLTESNLCIREYETEIARLRRALQDHGRHERSCEQNDEGDDCTCGFTAALKGGLIMWEDETPDQTMARQCMDEIHKLQETVAELRAELRAERERLLQSLTVIANGPPTEMANGEVASWAAHLALYALASPAAAEEPSTKGCYGAECNRASCHNVPATWKHRDIPRYYCPPCGMWINENNSDCDPPLCGPAPGDAT